MKAFFAFFFVSLCVSVRCNLLSDAHDSVVQLGKDNHDEALKKSEEFMNHEEGMLNAQEIMDHDETMKEISGMVDDKVLQTAQDLHEGVGSLFGGLHDKLFGHQ